MIRARVDTEIARPAADVFAVLSDAERNPLWQRGMRSCRWTTPPPLTAGSEYEQEAAFLGRRVRTRFVVTSLDPGRRLTLASLPGSSFPLAVTREVEPLGPGRCRASEAVEGDPSGVYRLAAPLLRALVLRSMRSDHRRLRRLLEEGRTA